MSVLRETNATRRMYRDHSARHARACDGLLKADTWGSSIVRFGLGWGCRPPIGFRFRVILGTLGRSLIPGSSWTSSPTSSAIGKLGAGTDRPGGPVIPSWLLTVLSLQHENVALTAT